ncbi:MAG: molybdopterin-dependent oxidoreductase [Chloroflexi bacterium]|nr:molybdopterin-dependent oxidoreductase [Chloroflexota bacterium]
MNSVIGTSVARHDLPGKLTGEARYASDIQLPGMLHGKIVRSPHPHARITSIDASHLENLDGVHAVLTPFDVPSGRLAPDLPILDLEVRFVGDEVAAVAADDEDLAEYAASLLEVRYEQLPFVTTAREALESGDALVHPEGNLVGGEPLALTRGDVDEGFEEADRIFSMSFSTPAHSPAPLEPRAAVAMWEDGKLTVWKTSRGVHADRLSLASALGVHRDDVRVIGATLGAGFGGKDESRLSVIAAELARRAGKPVKIEATREEEFVAGRKRHSTETAVKVGVKNDGTVTAIHATTLMDTGAYLASGPGVVRRAGQAALYLYRCANVRYDGHLVYTNQPSAASYRALGAPQGHFALEVTMNHIADELGIDPLEFRLRNHVGIEGQAGERVTPANEIIDTQPVEGGIPFSSNGLRECLERGADAFGWKDREAAKRESQSQQQSQSQSEGRLKTGSGMSMLIYRGGPGGRSAARVRLNGDGSVQVIAGLMDVGEGSTTVIAQIVAEAVGVPYESVRVTFGDTADTPEAPITAGSTATFSTGTAAKQAAEELRAKILGVVATHLDDDVIGLSVVDGAVLSEDGNVRLALEDIAALAGAEELEAMASVMPGSRDHIVNSFGAHFAEVEVDTETGNVRVLRYVAAHDSGRILNPQLATNQVEGGVSQMLGFTLSEEMLTDPHSGVTLNASFLEHKSPTIQEYPPIEVIFADVVDPIGPYGAKALGEPPSVGVAPAVINAIYDAVGVCITDLPATPDKVLDALREQEGVQEDA